MLLVPNVFLVGGEVGVRRGSVSISDTDSQKADSRLVYLAMRGSSYTLPAPKHSHQLTLRGHFSLTLQEQNLWQYQVDSRLAPLSLVDLNFLQFLVIRVRKQDGLA